MTREKTLSTQEEHFSAPKLPKGQELDDHYFGAIKTRVADYMKRPRRRALEARYPR